MPNPGKQNAPAGGGAKFRPVAAGTKRQRKVLKCSTHHISRLRRELQNQGLTLRDTSGKTQCETLLRVLQYVGDRGINTLEGMGLGFYRIATRIQELEALGWMIDSQRERVVGADGLSHVGVARYVLRGFLMTRVDPQGSLDLGVV